MLNVDISTLTKHEAQSRLAHLQEEITKHDRLYHGLDNPEISDREYDRLKDEWLDLAVAFPDLAEEEQVGFTVSPSFESVKHSVRMFSLEKASTEQAVQAWHERLVKAFGRDCDQIVGGYSCEPKFDGMAVSILYQNGKLERALTRGDGIIGEDVTRTVRVINDLPLQLNGKAPEKLEVRGEIYLPTTAFNAMLNADSEETLKSKRNIASGSIRQKNPQITATRGLSWFAYSVAETKSISEVSYHTDILEFLEKLGLPVTDQKAHCSNIDEVLEYLQYAEETQHEHNWDADGIVIKLNSLLHQKQVGFTSHHPKFALAYKFETDVAETVLENIEIQIGRTGKATPVGILREVTVGDVSVSRATLSNADQVKQKDVRPGDIVKIRRSGDVIPEILMAVIEERPESTRPWDFPSVCPCSEKAPLIRNEGDAAHYCSLKDNCPERRWRMILHFASRKGMNIESLGEQWIEEFYKQGVLYSSADLYDIPTSKKEEVKNIRVRRNISFHEAAKTAKYMNSIKNKPLYQILSALITKVGPVTAKEILAVFPDISNLSAISVEKLVAVKGVGPETAKIIAEFFSFSESKSLFYELQQAGVVALLDDDLSEFSGQPVCLTEDIIKKFVAMSETETGELTALGNPCKESASEIVLMLAVEQGVVKNISNMVNVKIETLLKTFKEARFGEGQMDNLNEALNNSKNLPLSKLLVALGIPLVGDATARILADSFGDIDNIIKASDDELSSKEGIGEVAGREIARFFENPEVLDTIERLKSVGVNTKSTTITGGTLQGLTICVTGQVPGYKRTDIKDTIEQHGGILSSSITHNVNVLIADATAASRKVKDAKNLGIRIESPEWLLSQLLNQTNGNISN